MLNYRPGPTGEKFLASRAFIKLICGPVGGGKSTVALFDILSRVVQQAPHNGVRRSKVIISRNTLPQLKTTVKPLIDQWLVEMTGGRMGAWKVTENVFEMKFKLKDGTVVEADLLMLPADTEEDIRRLLSVECSFAWVEECREYNSEVFSALQGRTNRYPNRAAGGVTYAGVIGSTNPPAVGTFWHGVMTTVPKFWEVFMQPPALLDDGSLNVRDRVMPQDAINDAERQLPAGTVLPKAENLDNLAPDYYEKLISGKTQEWINVYLKNQFGSGGAGLPIFRQTFRKDFHVSKTHLNPLLQTASPFIIGMDNGLTAAAVIGQLDPRARVNVLDEAYVPEGTTMGVERFMDTILIPKLRQRYPFMRPENVLFVLDPACFERSQVNEKTIAMAVNQRGFKAVRAVTNDPERRIAAVEGLLSRAIDGGPGMLISPVCTHFIAALEWGYRYKPQKDSLAPLTIDKNFFSHIADAGQYLSLHFNAQTDPAMAMFRPKARPVENRPYIYS